MREVCYGRGRFMGEEVKWESKVIGDVCIWEREVCERKRQIGKGIQEREVEEGDEQQKDEMGEGGNGRGW